MKNGFKRALSMLLCLTMVLGLFCYAPEASALVDSSGYECTGSVEQLLRASSDAVAGQCYRIRVVRPLGRRIFVIFVIFRRRIYQRADNRGKRISFLNEIE